MFGQRWQRSGRWVALTLALAISGVANAEPDAAPRRPGLFDIDLPPTTSPTTSATTVPSTGPTSQPDLSERPTSRPVVGAATRPTTRPADGGRSISEVMADVRPNLCRVSVAEMGHGYSGYGCGAAISEDGFIVTNAYLFNQSRIAEVEFPDQALRLPAQVWQIWPEYRIALLKVDATFMHPLKLAAGLPDQGQDVFSLGFPISPQGSLKLTRGLVSAIVDLAEVRALQRHKDDGFADGVRFIQADCPVLFGQSCGPLIDGEGIVVGWSTPLTLNGANSYIALSARHIADAFERRNPAAPSVPTKADPTEGAFFADDPPPATKPSRIPDDIRPEQLRQPPTKNRSPATLAPVLSDLAKIRGVPCSNCGGDGRVEWEVQIGTRREGTFDVPVMEQRSKPCDSCNASGKVAPKPALVRQAAERAALAMAELDPAIQFDDPKLKDLARRWDAVSLQNVLRFADTQAWTAELFKRDDAGAFASGAPIFSVFSVLTRQNIDGVTHYVLYSGSRGVYLITGQMHRADVKSLRAVLVGVTGETVKVGDIRYVVVHGGVIVDAPTELQHGPQGSQRGVFRPGRP